MKIYDEITGAELLSADEELGCIYGGQRKIGEEPERIEVIEGTVTPDYPDGLRQLIPAKPVYEDCLYYHTYTAQEAVQRYKELLTATDYVIIKIAEGAAAREEYEDVITRRRLWRQKINELEAV